MRFIPLFAASAACLLLGACANRLPVGNNIVAAQPKTPATHGDTPVIVRTFKFDSETVGNRGDEVAGVDCKVTSQHFSATLRSPATLTTPLYGVATPTLTITCSKQGLGSGSRVVSPYNKTQSDMINAGANAGLAGLLLMGAVAATSDNKGHQFLYNPEVFITLQPQ